MRQGHHVEQLLEAKGKLLFSLFFLPGAACPRGAPPAAWGCAGQLGAARLRLPSFPGARRSCCQQRGTELVSCPSPSSPPAPDVPLCRWLLCPSLGPLVPTQPLAGAGVQLRAREPLQLRAAWPCPGLGGGRRGQLLSRLGGTQG